MATPSSDTATLQAQLAEARAEAEKAKKSAMRWKSKHDAVKEATRAAAQAAAAPRTEGLSSTRRSFCARCATSCRPAPCTPATVEKLPCTLSSASTLSAMRSKSSCERDATECGARRLSNCQINRGTSTSYFSACCVACDDFSDAIINQRSVRFSLAPTARAPRRPPPPPCPRSARRTIRRARARRTRRRRRRRSSRRGWLDLDRSAAACSGRARSSSSRFSLRRVGGLEEEEHPRGGELSLGRAAALGSERLVVLREADAVGDAEGGALRLDVHIATAGGIVADAQKSRNRTTRTWVAASSARIANARSSASSARSSLPLRIASVRHRCVASSVGAWSARVQVRRRLRQRLRRRRERLARRVLVGRLLGLLLLAALAASRRPPSSFAASASAFAFASDSAFAFASAFRRLLSAFLRSAALIAVPKTPSAAASAADLCGLSASFR